jgi:hypothetical protein
MIDGCTYADGDIASALLERRWFGAAAAARTMQVECEVLNEIMELAAADWRRSRARLEVLEKLRDALGEQLAALDGQCAKLACDAGNSAVMSAA